MKEPVDRLGCSSTEPEGEGGKRFCRRSSCGLVADILGMLSLRSGLGLEGVEESTVTLVIWHHGRAWGPYVRLAQDSAPLEVTLPLWGM